MISWTTAVHLGNTSIMLPLAAAITTWLLLARRWRLAIWWVFLFSTGLGTVIATKMYYISRITTDLRPDYKGLSGHAMLTSAILPVATYLIVKKLSTPSRNLALGLSILTCTGMVGCLVALKFHSLSEAIGGAGVGIAVSLAFIWMAESTPATVAPRWQLPVTLLVIALVSYANPAALEHWLSELAPHIFA